MENDDADHGSTVIYEDDEEAGEYELEEDTSYTNNTIDHRMQPDHPAQEARDTEDANYVYTPR